MCVTISPAKLSKTIIYAGEARVNEKYLHVLGYQNQATNLARGPNAMILPIPSKAQMGPQNVVDTSKCRNILKDYQRTVAMPTSNRMSKSADVFRSYKGVAQVFDSGMYTMVLADYAAQVPEALERVPANKRPYVNMELLTAYEEWYQGWPIAVCCFESEASVAADPIVWAYEPLVPDMLFIPTLDSHNGGIPQVGRRKELDHTFVFGSTIHPLGRKVSLTKGDEIDAVNQYLPSLVFGTRNMNHHEEGATYYNGDHWLKTEKLTQQRSGTVVKAPPGYVSPDGVEVHHE